MQTLRETPWEQERNKNAQPLEKASERRGKPKGQQVKGSSFSDKAVEDEAASCLLAVCLPLARFLAQWCRGAGYGGPDAKS